MAKNFIPWRKPFRRLNKAPLDISSVFSSYTQALEYAQGTRTEEGAAYLGQLVSVIEENESGITVTAYKIAWDNSGQTQTLEEIGSGKGSVADIKSRDGDIKVEIEDTTVYLKLNSISNPEFEFNNGTFTKIASE